MEPAPDPEPQDFPEPADDPDATTLCFSCEEEGTQAYVFPWKMCKPGSEFEQLEFIQELQIDLCEECYCNITQYSEAGAVIYGEDWIEAVNWLLSIPA